MKKTQPIVLREFTAGPLQAPATDIAAARPPRRGMARQTVPFLPDYELADVRGVHGGADGMVYIEATVKLDRACRGALAYGADGPVKVWVNDRAADCRPHATNPVLKGEFMVPVSWKPGMNRISFALGTNHGKAWGVQANVIPEPVVADETPTGVPAIAWVPFPKRAVAGKGTLSLNEKTRIVATDPALAPLAHIVSGEIEALTGRRFAVADRPPEPADIVLGIDGKLKGEAYVFEVGEQAVVCAGNYAAVAAGTVTLLQALKVGTALATLRSQRRLPSLRSTSRAVRGRLGEASLPKDHQHVTEATPVTLPCVTVRDEPTSPYRGLMIDLARSWHSLKNVKDLVVLCRWYKLNTLHLHFTDGGSFTFPSAAYPQLRTPVGRYTVEQLRDLEAFARDCGVAILPELDVPGHASALVRLMPDVFANEPNTVEDSICPGRERAYEVLDTLIGEMTDIFRTTPYFHIGGDEVVMDPWKTCSDCMAYMARNKIPDEIELYRHFIVRMNKIVKKHGKKMIVWEGFRKAGKIKIPRDVTVMVFVCCENLPDVLLDQGYRVINAACQPLYVVGGGRMWAPAYIYGWNQYRWESYTEVSKAHEKPIDVKPSELVLGAELCSWEQGEKIELRTLRSRVPAMSERLWNPDAGRSYADFNRRFCDCDQMLDRLIVLTKASFARSPII